MLRLGYVDVVGSVPVGLGRRGWGGSAGLFRRFAVVFVRFEPVGCCLVVLQGWLAVCEPTQSGLV